MIEDEKLPSGKLTLRMPKFLHKQLADLAKNENVSLNQYCTALLNDKIISESEKIKFNKDLITIRKNSQNEEELIYNISKKNKQVRRYKDIIKDEIDEMINEKGKLTKIDEEYLSWKYPVVSLGKNIVDLKVPTLKIVIDPKYENTRFNDEELQHICINETFKNILRYTINNVDELDYSYKMAVNYKYAMSRVIYILDENMNIVLEYINQIREKLKNNGYYENYNIRLEVTYILVPLTE